MRLLIEGGTWQQTPILTEVYTVENEKDTSSLFMEINKSQPVKEIDLPGQAETKERIAIDFASSELECFYGTMFSTSQRCRIPHLNLDNLRQGLYDCHDAMSAVNSAHAKDPGKFIIVTFQIHLTSLMFKGTVLLDWIEKQNEKLSKYTDREWEAIRKKKHGNKSKEAFHKALSKSRKTGMFLGLDDEWLLSSS